MVVGIPSYISTNILFSNSCVKKARDKRGTLVVFFVNITLITSIVFAYMFAIPVILKTIAKPQNDFFDVPIVLEINIYHYTLLIFKVTKKVILTFKLIAFLAILQNYTVYYFSIKKYFIVSLLIATALIAPPDIFSQILFFCLVTILYEIFYIITFLFKRKVNAQFRIHQK